MKIFFKLLCEDLVVESLSYECQLHGSELKLEL